MTWIFLIAICTVIVFLFLNFQAKRRAAHLIAELGEKWGKPREDKYYNFAAIARYFENSKQEDAFQVISEQTAKDLDFESLFKFLDRTTSGVGQQYLYKKLRLVQKETAETRQAVLVEMFAKDETFRLAIQKQLFRLSSSDAYALEYWTQEHEAQNPKQKYWCVLLCCLVVASLVIGLFKPFFFVFLVPLFAVNMVFHYINKKNIIYHRSSITQLSIAQSIASNFAKQEELTKHFDFSFLTELKVLKNKLAFVGQEKRLRAEIEELIWLFLELLKILFNFEILLFFSVEKTLLAKRSAIVKLYDCIGEIDTAIAVADLGAGELPVCVPVFSENKRIIAKELQHPLLTDCVPNDLDLEKKSMLLTGSNMSGKTTFIKTIGINSLLAQTLDFCFASYYEAPFFRIYASVKVTDDLLSATSYYLQEVLNIKKCIDALDTDTFSLFILDELFKGTNTTERIAAGAAVLSCLNQDKSVVLVSTHDLELATLLQHKAYTLYCFDEQIANGEIHFSYKLKHGIPQDRNAIKILALYNYPASLVNEAQQLAAEGC